MSSPIMNSPGMVDAARFSEAMKATQKESLDDAKIAVAQQIESKESLESDKTDESEMIATLKKAEAIKKGATKNRESSKARFIVYSPSRK